MNDDLLAELRDGVNNGSVPLPISGESVNDFRFRAAHAGALIGVMWLQQAQVAEAERDEAERARNTDDTSGQGWRHGDSTGTSPQFAVVPPEQNEAAGV
jgi:hypothetical protein